MKDHLLDILSLAITAACAFLFLFATPQPLVAAELVRAPYLQNATPNSMTVRWMTDVPAQSFVWYRPEAGGSAVTVSSTTPKIHHEIEITGLTPATTYRYAVIDENGILAPPDENRFFRTSPLLSLIHI